MVMVNLMCASVMEARGEHARTYVYVSDNGEEREQGTLRDNNRGRELADLILAGSPACVNGEPPAGARLIARVAMIVMDARRKKATHAVTIERLAFEGRYFDAWCKMQRTERELNDIILMAARARDRELAAKKAAKEA